jgi:SAM-dependent methyltransferase
MSTAPGPDLDRRSAAARYYDLAPSPFDGQDVPFYVARLPTHAARVLELGCGTGRVLVPLAPHCAYLHGIDLSNAMLAMCRERLAAAGIGRRRACAEPGDITRLDLGQTFDLIIAPFRVFQNLETDAQVTGFFDSVRRHLAPGGRCILNVFRPFAGAAEVRARWAARTADEQVWSRPFGAGQVVAFERLGGMHPDRMIFYPVLTYRYYQGEALVDEAMLQITMRCYYPAEFEQLIVDNDFRVLNRWGGYAGEPYGEGPELVVEFSQAR